MGLVRVMELALRVRVRGRRSTRTASSTPQHRSWARAIEGVRGKAARCALGLMQRMKCDCVPGWGQG